MKIAVTGHLGFIGKNLVRAISKKPDTTFYFADLSNGRDILDVKLPENTDVIFHLAAQADVQESIKDPLYDAMNNIIATIKLLLQNPEAKIIIASSVASKDPKSPYGIAKKAIESYSQVIHKNTVVCRLPNIFALNGGNGVVRKFIEAETVVVYGSGDQVRDFVHVNDIVRGLIMAVSWNPGIYELGSGKSVSVNELAEATGKEIVKIGELPGEIKESKAENTTPNWKPEIDVLEFISKHSKKWKNQETG